MKRIIFIVVIVICILSISHSVANIYDLWKKQDVITVEKQELQKDKQENTRLTEQLHKVSNPSFIEEEARNKLFMTKPGESVVFVSQDLLASNSGQQAAQNTSPNWQQWWSLFF